jgi:hypothetical protein
MAHILISFLCIFKHFQILQGSTHSLYQHCVWHEPLKSFMPIKELFSILTMYFKYI